MLEAAMVDEELEELRTFGRRMLMLEGSPSPKILRFFPSDWDWVSTIWAQGSVGLRLPISKLLEERSGVSVLALKLTWS
jgi:hypothetical protein